MSKIKYKVKFGKILTGDLYEKTITYEFEDDFILQAGEFAIIEKKHFEELVRALKSCVMAMQAHPECEPDSEFDGFVSSGWKALENVLELHK